MDKKRQNVSTVTVKFPVDFIKAMAKANTVQEVLDITAYWLPSIVDADRASITLADPVDPEHLKIYSLQGEQAIPLHTAIPIKGTIVGGCFTDRAVVRCDDMENSPTLDGQMLYKAGLKSCLNAPMINGNQCFGTLNVAHGVESFYNEEQCLIMECMAGWLASHIRILDKAKKNQTLANTDFLTGLLNRRSFINKATECLQDFKK